MQLRVFINLASNIFDIQWNISVVKKFIQIKKSIDVLYRKKGKTSDTRVSYSLSIPYKISKAYFVNRTINYITLKNYEHVLSKQVCIES